jgi:glycerophosphoryl diester phosphodiesterase
MNALLAETREALMQPGAIGEMFTARPAIPRPRRVAAATVTVGALFGLALITPSAALAAPVPAAAETAILAHRGDIWGGVENTLGALEAAARSHPDYVEVDVQETRDGVFVASHDTNLLVNAGVNRNIFEMDAAEVTTTVVREHGFTATIPTMAEYVTRARALGVPLLIELKVHGHEEPGYVERFLAELDALGATDDEIYHSLDPGTVAELKRDRPGLRVGLTIALSLGGAPDTAADFFVIEQASFTEDFLEQAHRLGKPVYVWTVDDDDRIRALLRTPVDGIVTDQPRRAIAFRSELATTVTQEDQAVDALRPLTAFQ